MNNGTILSIITKYRSQLYYDEHLTLQQLTPEGNNTIELIAGIVNKPTGDVYNTDLTFETVRKLL